MSSHQDSKAVPEKPATGKDRDQSKRATEAAGAVGADPELTGSELLGQQVGEARLDPADFDALTAGGRKPTARATELQGTASAIGMQDLEDASGEAGDRAVDAARDGVFGLGLDDAARGGEDAGLDANEVLRDVDSAREDAFEVVEDAYFRGAQDTIEAVEDAPGRVQDVVESLDQNAIPNEIYGRALPKAAAAYETAREQVEDAINDAPEAIQGGFFDVGREELRAFEAGQELAQDAAATGQDVADAAEDAVDAAQDAAEDAAEDVGDAIEDANPFD